MSSPPWRGERGVDAVLDRWLASSWVKPCFCADEKRAPTDGSYAGIPAELAPELARALENRGISRLYSHQASAFEHARAGHHVVIATPTASGKSLAFTYRFCKPSGTIRRPAPSISIRRRRSRAIKRRAYAICSWQPDSARAPSCTTATPQRMRGARRGNAPVSYSPTRT